MKHCVLISPTDSKLINALKERDFDIISTAPLEVDILYERMHADMQCLVIEDTVFLAKACEGYAKDFLLNYSRVVICENPTGKYPENVSLNALFIGRKLFCKETSLDINVRDFCVENRIEIVNVNQGYARCSTLILGSKGIVTADESIYKRTSEFGIKALRIAPGHITLEGASYGFIGGSSVVVGDKVLFFGDIFTHPSAREITDFIHECGFEFECLTKDKLHDVGSAIIVY